MGSRGPTPKRSTQRRRSNSSQQTSTAPAGTGPAGVGDLMARTRDELIAQARALGITPGTRWTKTQLAEAITGREDPSSPDAAWHPIARQWFESLEGSGQSAFYEASDWATARMIAESMSRELNPQPILAGDQVVMATMPPKAASVSAWLKGMTALLVTEGDRRRVGLELQKVQPSSEEGADVVSELDEWRDRLRSG